MSNWWIRSFDTPVSLVALAFSNGHTAHGSTGAFRTARG